MFKLDRVPNLFKYREEFKPFEYPKYFDLGWMPQSSAFWLHTKIPMGTDVKDWNEKLTPFEKKLVEKILLGFAQTECAVADYWTGKVAKWFPKHEIKQMAMTFGYFETIHSTAYFYLNETLGLDKEEHSFRQDEKISARIDNLVDAEIYTNSDELDYYKLALSLAVFSGVAEGVSLFGSFVPMLSFQPRQLLEGVGNQMAWSIRDESLHSDMGCMLFKDMVKEIPELLTYNDGSLEKEIRKAFDDGLKLEENFIEYVFEDGNLPNLTKEQLINFLRYRVADRLDELGFKSHVSFDKEMLREVSDWFDRLTGDNIKPDFFHTKPTEYAVSEHDWSSENL